MQHLSPLLFAFLSVIVGGACGDDEDDPCPAGTLDCACDEANFGVAPCNAGLECSLAEFCVEERTATADPPEAYGYCLGGFNDAQLSDPYEMCGSIGNGAVCLPTHWFYGACTFACDLVDPQCPSAGGAAMSSECVQVYNDAPVCIIPCSTDGDCAGAHEGMECTAIGDGVGACGYTEDPT